VIGIVDYGVGNLRSVEKALAAVGAEARVSSQRRELGACAGLVLPGVGAFGDAMAGLTSSGLDEVVLEAVSAGRPLLGLCVGYQMLFDESSEFGQHAGLGLLPGRVVRFDDSVGPIPHVGWNKVEATYPHPLLSGLGEAPFLYFVHSYYVEATNTKEVLATSEYGGQRFASVCGSGRVFGVQFHPEKSQAVGLALLANFARLVAQA
jgi:glutamine amidotransferase